jgi:hypothetical protein
LEDFNTLASSLAAGLGDLRGCLILSRDGLVLGSSPADAESSLTPAWVRFAALGDTERGFVQFGVESWCYVRRGPYAAFAIAGPGARPGLVLDQMDQALLAAEQGRARHEGFVARVEATPPTTRPRTHLHPEPAHGKEPVVIDVPRTPATVEASTDLPTAPDRDLGFGPLPRMFDTRPADDPAAPARTTDAPAAPPTEHEQPWADVETAASEPELALDLDLAEERSYEPRPELEPADEPSGSDQPVDPSDPATEGRPTTPETAPWDGGPERWESESDEPDDVDRFSLAQEFGQLLQRGEDPADG